MPALKHTPPPNSRPYASPHWVGVTPSFFDVDNDGHTDLIFGEYVNASARPASSRKITYYRNTGTQRSPKYTLMSAASSPFTSINTAMAPNITNRQFLSAIFADLDDDGLADVVIVGSSGDKNLSPYKPKLYHYRNTGEAQSSAYGYCSHLTYGVGAHAIDPIRRRASQYTRWCRRAPWTTLTTQRGGVPSTLAYVRLRVVIRVRIQRKCKFQYDANTNATTYHYKPRTHVSIDVNAIADANEFRSKAPS